MNDTARLGDRNDITDVAGIAVGHHQRRGRGWLTGTTVVVPPSGAVAAVDVRGGGPGTRETDAIGPANMIDSVDAVCLTGGSAYGLAAADGVVQWLAERNRGFRVGPADHHVVPIVPTAVLFDLGTGGKFEHRPTAEFGRKAIAAARPNEVRQGNHGAGTGSHAGLLKGGIGTASVVLAGGVTVAALVALNSSGSVFDPRTGRLWGLDRGLPGEFGGVRTPTRADLRRHHDEPLTYHQLNTTLAVIATDAVVDKGGLARIAGAGHDGMARAIDPIHQFVDGDVVFALATGTTPVPPIQGAPRHDGDVGGVLRPYANPRVDLVPVIAAAADVVSRAIVHAALAAESAGPLMSYLDRFPSARR